MPVSYTKYLCTHFACVGQPVLSAMASEHVAMELDGTAERVMHGLPSTPGRTLHTIAS